MQETLYIKRCSAPKSYAWSFNHKSNVFYSNEDGTEFYVYTKSPGDWGYTKTLEVIDTFDNISDCANAFTYLKKQYEYSKDTYCVISYLSTEILEEDYKRVMTGETFVQDGQTMYEYFHWMTKSKYDKYYSHITDMQSFPTWRMAREEMENRMAKLGLLMPGEVYQKVDEINRSNRHKAAKETLKSFNEQDILSTRSKRYQMEETQERCHHLYFLYDNDEIVYVGQTTASSGDPTQRPRQHTDKKYDSFETFKVPDNINIDVAEAYFINKLKPKYNKSLPISEKVFE